MLALARCEAALLSGPFLPKPGSLDPRYLRYRRAVFARVGCAVVDAGLEITQHCLAATHGTGESPPQFDLVALRRQFSELNTASVAPGQVTSVELKVKLK